ncbi:unnamed protein product [Amoebophrya sp. A120]|nr:unnamed protein product [Amoebophrya sp. A120]|eukprot:GSA120T00000296001.1
MVPMEQHFEERFGTVGALPTISPHTSHSRDEIADFNINMAMRRKYQKESPSARLRQNMKEQERLIAAAALRRVRNEGGNEEENGQARQENCATRGGISTSTSRKSRKISEKTCLGTATGEHQHGSEDNKTPATSTSSTSSGKGRKNFREDGSSMIVPHSGDAEHVDSEARQRTKDRIREKSASDPQASMGSSTGITADDGEESRDRAVTHHRTAPSGGASSGSSLYNPAQRGAPHDVFARRYSLGSTSGSSMGSGNYRVGKTGYTSHGARASNQEFLKLSAFRVQRGIDRRTPHSMPKDQANKARTLLGEAEGEPGVPFSARPPATDAEFSIGLALRKSVRGAIRQAAASSGNHAAGVDDQQLNSGARNNAGSGKWPSSGEKVTGSTATAPAVFQQPNFRSTGPGGSCSSTASTASNVEGRRAPSQLPNVQEEHQASSTRAGAQEKNRHLQSSPGSSTSPSFSSPGQGAHIAAAGLLPQHDGNKPLQRINLERARRIQGTPQKKQGVNSYGDLVKHSRLLNAPVIMLTNSFVSDTVDRDDGRTDILSPANYSKVKNIESTGSSPLKLHNGVLAGGGPSSTGTATASSAPGLFSHADSAMGRVFSKSLRSVTENSFLHRAVFSSRSGSCGATDPSRGQNDKNQNSLKKSEKTSNAPPEDGAGADAAGQEQHVADANDTKHQTTPAPSGIARRAAGEGTTLSSAGSKQAATLARMNPALGQVEAEPEMTRLAVESSGDDRTGAKKVHMDDVIVIAGEDVLEPFNHFHHADQDGNGMEPSTSLVIVPPEQQHIVVSVVGSSGSHEDDQDAAAGAAHQGGPTRTEARFLEVPSTSENMKGPSLTAADQHFSHEERNQSRDSSKTSVRPSKTRKTRHNTQCYGLLYANEENPDRVVFVGCLMCFCGLPCHSYVCPVPCANLSHRHGRALCALCTLFAPLAWVLAVLYSCCSAHGGWRSWCRSACATRNPPPGKEMKTELDEVARKNKTTSTTDDGGKKRPLGGEVGWRKNSGADGRDVLDVQSGMHVVGSNSKEIPQNSRSSAATAHDTTTTAPSEQVIEV